MASDNEEEVVLTFTVKGGDVAVRQIKQVEKATDNLDESTQRTAKAAGDAWLRYAKTAGGAMASVGKSVSQSLLASEEAQKLMAVSILAGLAAGAKAYQRGGVGLIAAAGITARAAATAFNKALLAGPGGMLATLSTAREAIAKGGGLSTMAAAGLGLGAKAASSYGGIAGAAGGAVLGGLSKSVGAIGIGGTLGVGLAAAAPIYAGYKALQWGAGGMQGASDQIEARNRVDSLLGKGASKRQLAGVNPAEQMGMTTTQYLTQYGSLTASLTGAGMSKGAARDKSGSLVQLAADLGSFNNLSSEEAALAIQAGLRGENDSLERAGIVINQKSVDIQAQKMFGKNAAQLAPAEATQARLAAIEESTGAQQAKGDFTRSLPTSLEGQRKVAEARMADAQERLGDSMNKIVLAVMPLAEPLLDILDFLVGVLKPVLDAIAAVLKALVDHLFPKPTGINAKEHTVTINTGVGMSYDLPFLEPDVRTNGDRMQEAVTGYREQSQRPANAPAPSVPLDPSVGTTSSNNPVFGPQPGLARGGTLGGWSPGIDNMLVPLSGGEGILTPETVELMGGPQAVDRANALGLRSRGRGRSGYSNGIGNAQAAAAMIGGGAKNIHLQTVRGIFGKGMPVVPGAPGVPGAGGAATGYTGSLGGDLVVNDGVVTEESFLSYAAAALQAKGMNPADAIHLLRQAQHESSLRVTAINNTDSNAQAGHPSQGILQFIPSTFAEYAEPGHTNFLDPRDQIWAALNYVPARYGSIAALGTDRGYGAYGAYDSGGWLPPGVMQTVNKTGEPEAVLTGDQWKDVKQLASAGGGGGGVTVNIGTITVDASGGGDNLASVVVDKLGDAIATRVNRANDRRL